MDSLDLEAANKFLAEKLGLLEWKTLKEQDPLKLIRRIVYQYITHPQYAFHNVNMAATTPAERTAPTKASSIATCLTTLRGMCIDHNYFLAVLFKVIGYDAFIVGSTVSLLPMPLNHPLCIIRLASGMWLVDMGMGSVFHEPIPLHRLPVQFRVGGFTCEYREASGDTGIYQRVHIHGDPMKGEFDNEEVRYHFTLEELPYEEFNPAMVEIFTDTACSFFLNNLYSFRYLNLNLDSTPVQFNAVAFMGTTLVRFSEKDYSKTVYDSYDAMESVYAEYFPAIGVELYRKATQYFQTSDERKAEN